VVIDFWDFHLWPYCRNNNYVHYTSGSSKGVVRLDVHILQLWRPGIFFGAVYSSVRYLSTWPPLE
jgi:hypothetical protein